MLHTNWIGTMTFKTGRGTACESALEVHTGQRTLHIQLNSHNFAWTNLQAALLMSCIKIHER